MPHATTTHPLTIRAIQATKLGFLSRPLPSPLTELGFLSLLLLPLNGSQQNVPMVASSAPIEFPHLQQIHTQTLGKDHNPSSTVCQHTPAPPFPHSQLPPFCKSQLTRDPPRPTLPHVNLMAIRWNKLVTPGVSNRGFSGGSWTS